MNPQEQEARTAFASRYRDEVEEILILSGEITHGANRCGGDILWNVSCDFLAYQGSTGFYAHEGSVNWQSKDEETELARDHLYDIAEFDVCRLRVRAHKTQPYEFMLLEILESGIVHSDFAAVRESYLVPVQWQENPFPPFTLDKQLGNFVGEIVWLGQNITVIIANDNEENRMRPSEPALTTLRLLYAEPATWQNKLSAYATQELLELANNEWLEDGSHPISAEAFIDRIVLNSLSIYNDGSFTALFSDDDIFCGHYILVEGGADGSLYDVDITG
ncbi:MAG: DUF2262 domain-containing protein [Cardiobacteriaceae bacterium]|nr:DUF2262 domain-containing protein [Cardiobacteriaceae bacterium]